MNNPVREKHFMTAHGNLNQLLWNYVADNTYPVMEKHLESYMHAAAISGNEEAAEGVKKFAGEVDRLYGKVA